MIRNKPFPSVSALTSWFNRAEHARYRLIGTPCEGKEVIAIYEVPEDAKEPDIDPENQRLAILAAKMIAHLDYPDATKKELNYPPGILPFRVVPFARLHNSIRNLTPFQGLNDSKEWVRENLPKLGYQVLTRAEAKAEYDTNATLIE